MKRKSDIRIGQRYVVAARQLFPDISDKKIAKIIGCSPGMLYEWQEGKAPSGIYMQRLCYLGADINWILTGRSKQNEDNFRP